MAASTTKKIVLVTGANVGIGFELAAQLTTRGTYHVLLGSRSIDKGEAAVKELRSRNLPGSVELLRVDITDDESIAAAARSIEQQHGRLDILVNNAGISPVDVPLREQFRICFETNATGPALLTKALAHLLTPQTGRILNVSSGGGSIGRYLDPATKPYAAELDAYQASKAALNMITAVQTRDFEERGVKVAAYCPGFTQSSLAAFTTADAGAKPAIEAVLPMIDILEGKRDAEAGKFLEVNGVWPW